MQKLSFILYEKEFYRAEIQFSSFFFITLNSLVKTIIVFSKKFTVIILFKKKIKKHHTSNKSFSPSKPKKTLQMVFYHKLQKTCFFLFLLYVTFVFCQNKAKKRNFRKDTGFLVVISTRLSKA